MRSLIAATLVLAFSISVIAASDRDIPTLLAKRASGQEMTNSEYDALTDSVSEFTDLQLISVLHVGKNDLLRDMCRTEILTRAALRPHWTIVPAFWLIVLSVVISIAALAVATRAEFRARRNR